ncbi:MAG: hypothetical protein E5V41_22840, partial [Mesorhizobium sp.]
MLSTDAIRPRARATSGGTLIRLTAEKRNQGNPPDNRHKQRRIEMNRLIATPITRRGVLGAGLAAAGVLAM